MLSMIVVLVVLFALAYVWNNRKPVVPYNPSRYDILILLRKVFGGMNTEVEWESFVSVPIPSDEKLEDIRKKAEAIGAEIKYTTGLKEGFIFNEQGLLEIKKLINELEDYCQATGRGKNEFQVNCAQILEHKMQNFGMQFSKWDFVESPEESYYFGELKGVQVYVYADSAGIKTPQSSHMFDSANYKSESELMRAVVGKLTELTSGSGPVKL